MEHVNKIISRVLIETQEPTTKEKPTFTETLSLAEKSYPDFKTFKDRQLEEMLVAVFSFSKELWALDFSKSPITAKPRWLSLIGNSGTGKTFLADHLFEEAGCLDALRNHKELINPVIKTFWPKLLTQLRNGEYHRLADLADCNFVFIDEISIEHDPSGFGRDKLCELLSLRVGKWTLLTSNLTLEKLAAIDTRISSRMIRGGSVVVEVDTIDFYLR